MNRATAVRLGLLAFFAIAVRLPLMGMPLERDEGEYAYIAWRAQQGELPYHDWFDQKPPAIFWVYGLALKMPGNPIWAIHLMAALWTAASACALYFLALYFMTPAWGLVGAMLFAFLSADWTLEGTSANTELFMLLPMLLSLWVLMQSVRTARRPIFNPLSAGILIGLATAFKQVAVLNWPVIVAGYWLFNGSVSRTRKTIRFALLSIVGVSAVWIAIAAYFALRHGYRDFIYAVFTHNFAYIAAASWSDRLSRLLATAGTMVWTQGLVWMFSLAAFVFLARERNYKALTFFLIAAVAANAGVSASGYYFPHYFQQLLPVICLTAAIGGEKMEGLAFWRRTDPLLKRSALIALLALLPCIFSLPFLLFDSPEEALSKMYPKDSIFAVAKALGDHIAEVTKSGDTVYIFGAEPEILFYAHRRSATRYIFLFPLYGPYADADRLQHETANEVEANKPAMALDFPNHLFFVPGTDQYFTNWTTTYLHQYFEMDTLLEVDPFDHIHLQQILHGMLLNSDGTDSADQLPVYGVLYIRK